MAQTIGDFLLLGGDYQQEVDRVSLFKNVAHDYVQTASAGAA